MACLFRQRMFPLNCRCVLLLFQSALAGFRKFLLALGVRFPLVLDAALILLGCLLLLAGFGCEEFCVAAGVQVASALRLRVLVRVALVSVCV